MLYTILRCCWCNIGVLNVHTTCEGKSDDVKDSFYEELGRVFDQFPTHDTNILLGDFNVKVGWKDILKLTIGNESSHKISNDNGVRVANFATSKNLVVKITMLPHLCIHKYIWTSQIDHILIRGETAF
jgi:hypothetical protein